MKPRNLPEPTVAQAIIVVALIMIVAATIVTRPVVNREQAAKVAAEADRLAVATAGPMAGKTVVLGASATVPKDVSAACKVGMQAKGTNPNGTIDLAPAGAANTVIADGGSLDADVSYQVGGWAVGPNGDRLLSGLCLVVDGKVAPYAKTLYGFLRPDVAAAYHQDIAPCGYRIEIPPRVLPAGTHRLQVLTISSDGVKQFLPPVRTVAVSMPAAHR
jgi:hypothetical protein